MLRPLRSATLLLAHRLARPVLAADLLTRVFWYWTGAGNATCDVRMSCSWLFLNQSHSTTVFSQAIINQ